jgi:large subunit ribosomal protein L25
LENIELKAQIRETKGDGPAKALRRSGRVPAILYGCKTNPYMLSIDTHDLEILVKRGGISHSIINLDIDGLQGAKPAMVKEMQTNPVSQKILHVDFYEVDMKRKIWVNVPVTTTGKAIGVEMGGMLQIIRRELEVHCLPNAIPDAITIDITNLNVGESVHVNDIETDEGVDIPHEVNFTVLTILSPKKEAVGEGEEGEEMAEGEAAAAETQGAAGGADSEA